MDDDESKIAGKYDAPRGVMDEQMRKDCKLFGAALLSQRLTCSAGAASNKRVMAWAARRKA